MRIKLPRNTSFVACIIVLVSLLNWLLFAALTDVFQYPLELSSRNGGRCIASYLSPDGMYRADIYLYDETSMSLTGLRVRIESMTVPSKSWNVAYMYGINLYQYGEAFHELHWLDNSTIVINDIILDIFHMTYIE